LIVKNGKLELTDDISLRVIKCLGEVRDEDLIKKCAETTAMNDVTDLSYELVHDSPLLLPLSLSDWDKVTLLCKHMKNLKALELTCTVLNVEHERIVDVHTSCCLLEECIPPICELLTDERCNLNHLSLQLNRNDLSPGSLGMLKILMIMLLFTVS
jgi:hypothetical protein